MDMVRCKYIIRAFKEFNVLKNVNTMADRLKEGLTKISNIQNIRNCGLLFAFDFETKSHRNIFLKDLLQNNMLCNPTGEKTIRLRPNLFVTSEEVDHALLIMNEAGKKI